MPRTGPSGRRRFGATWWGRAWIHALEQRARLDPNRLPRGRTYARYDRVGAMTIEPGEVRAPVLGSRASAYRVQVRVRPFTDGEWDTALDAIAARAAHAAALLDGEMEPAIVEDLAAAGIDLLPVAGEVGTTCSCPDWANPCKHAAAVCYLIADLLDADPFGVLLLRGRTRDQVLAGLRGRRRAGDRLGAETGGLSRGRPDAGVAARDAFALTAARPARPGVPLPPAHPGPSAPLSTDPPADSGLAPSELASLAADAARRAWELATGEGDGGLGLDANADLARRAAAVLGTSSFARMVAASGRRSRDLVSLASAWRHGGAAALSVIDDRWDPPRDVLDDARTRLASRARLRIEANRVTLGRGVQLRYGRDGRWYRLERRAGRWEVVAAPDADPVVAAAS
ncbi:MAG: SWIM zinc finger family protein [Actinobacteria bacterium]|nr:SWIM zinc finger family protein [Actinomycetota bacterium]